MDDMTGEGIQGIKLCVLQLPSRVLEVELTLASSNYHTEMNPSDVGNHDRYVVQEILKVTHYNASLCGCHALLFALSLTACLAAPFAHLHKWFTAYRTWLKAGQST